MRVLVTGAAGRIGAAVAARLRSTHELVTTDQLATSGIDVVCDIRDRDAVARALEGMDAVVHCAALHAPHLGQHSEAEFHSINVEATAALIEEARRAGVRRMVYTSTTALYGAASLLPDRAAWIDEATPPQPLTIYHRSKLAAEALVRAAGAPDFRVRILRMSRCFPEPLPLMLVYRLHRGIDARDVAVAHELALGDAGADIATYVISAATPFRPEDAQALKHDAASVISERAPKLAEAFRARGWPLPDSIDRVYFAGMSRSGLGWRSRYGFEDLLDASA